MSSLYLTCTQITRPMPHGQPACKAAASSAAKGARVDGVAGNCTTRGWPSINALLLAGDVSDDLTILEQTLKDCVAAFDHVFFVPGNHCLWVRSTSQQTGWCGVGSGIAVGALCGLVPPRD